MNLQNPISSPLTTTPATTTPTPPNQGAGASARTTTGASFGMDFAQIMANQLAQMPALQQQAFASSQGLAQSLQTETPPQDSSPQESATNSSSEAEQVFAQVQASQPAGNTPTPSNVSASTSTSTTDLPPAATLVNPTTTPTKNTAGKSSSSTNDNTTSSVNPALLPNFFAAPTPINVISTPSAVNTTGLIGTSNSNLQTVALSQNLSIITPSQQATNTQSLTAFAQSMGLDQNAISQLMAKGSASPAPMSSPLSAAALQNATSLPNVATTTGNVSLMATGSTTPISPSATLMAALNMQASGTPATGVDVNVSSVSVASADTSASNSASSSQQILSTPNAMPQVNGAAVMSSAIAPITQPVMSAQQALSSSASALASSAATPAPSAPIATAMPDFQAQAQAMSATGTQNTPMLNNTASVKSLTIDANQGESDWLDTGLSSEEVSNLSSQLGMELPSVAVTGATGGAGVSANPNPNPALTWGSTPTTATNTSTANNTANSTSAANTPSEVKQQETYDELSTKLATEMAGRINKQLADGQWKMKFGLRPANLGGVEVQLEMNDGKLNTSFHTDNPVTAHLLQNASDRLRSTLENFGIQSGQVQVGTNAGGGQQNLSQQSPNTSQFVDNSGVQAKTSQEETTEQPSSGRLDSSSGLDLYA